jgi:hypothetical protein
LQVFHDDVAKVDLDVAMLHMCLVCVASVLYECWIFHKDISSPSAGRPPGQGRSRMRGIRARRPATTSPRWLRRTCLLLFFDIFMLQMLYIDVVTMFLTCCNRSSS